jgi:2-polyprenyl-3-methyl-5-hydroxy-6-metoxy-1,4-benzoquinol methylase
MNLSSALRDRILSDHAEFCRNVRKIDPAEGLEFILNDRYVKSQSDYYQSIFDRYGIDPTAVRILEVGSGYGFFLSYARAKLNWKIWGIEPLAERFEVAQRILQETNVSKDFLLQSFGENIGFGEMEFDVVLSNDVLEHVQNPEQVLIDSFRVLKKGGLLVFNIPNYNWIYEGHYNIPWIPGMSKSLAKKYVRLWGRDPEYIDTLQFLTPSIIRKHLCDIPQAKLEEPLESGSFDFISARIGAYLESTASLAGVKRIFVSAVFSFSKDAWGRKLLNMFAQATDVYHEMHVVAHKR